MKPLVLDGCRGRNHVFHRTDRSHGLVGKHRTYDVAHVWRQREEVLIGPNREGHRASARGLRRRLIHVIAEPAGYGIASNVADDPHDATRRRLGLRRSHGLTNPDEGTE